MIDGQLRVGVLLGGTDAPETIPATARLAEELGFDEVWVSEDLFYSAGLSTAVAVLGSTSRIRVGTGIVSIMTRAPALLALEIATIARLYPGRFIPGIGLGLPAWLEQMGVRPRSLGRALREVVDALHKLLGGEQLTVNGDVVCLEGVRLEYPIGTGVELPIGVAGPKLLELAGEIGEGVILGLNASPQYVRWALERIERGLAKRQERPRHFDVTCFVLFALEGTTSEAIQVVRERVAEYLALGGTNAMTDALGISDELGALIGAGGFHAVEANMPSEWVEDLSVAGDRETCLGQIGRFRDAGVESIVLYPQSKGSVEDTLRRAAAELLPALRRDGGA